MREYRPLKKSQKMFIPVGLSRNLLIRTPLSTYGKLKETAASEGISVTLLVNQLIETGFEARAERPNAA